MASIQYILILVGCATVTQPGDFKCSVDLDRICRAPSAANNYIGRFYMKPDNTELAKNISQNQCSVYGGLLSGPYTNPVYSILGESFYEFRCNGFSKFPDRNIPTPKGPQLELPQPSIPARLENSIGINDAKLKCSDLGFNFGTEEFGNCVLRLSK